MIPPWQYTALELAAAINNLEGFLKVKAPKNTAQNSTKETNPSFKNSPPRQTKRKPQSLKCAEKACENEAIHPLADGRAFCITHFRHGEES